MNAVVAAERWLYSTLTADATLSGLVLTRVYGHTVPTGAARPFVYYTMPAAADNVNTLEARRIWSPLLYAVRYVDKVESYVALEAGASAIENALSRASGSNVSGTIIGCIYESPFTMVELSSDGLEIRHLGGIFRLYVQ